MSMRILRGLFACAALFSVFVFSSCDILRLSPFEVAGWEPGGGYHENSADVVPSLRFSRDPDRSSVERHFSLAADGERVAGSFRWEGRKVFFVPASPLEINRDYTIKLAAAASDNEGLSLDGDFEGRFTTRRGSERPVLLSVYPGMNALIPEPRSEVRLIFSLPLSLNSLRENVSFSPSMGGAWTLENSGKTAVFTPAEPWTHGKRYELLLSASLAGSDGLKTGSDFFSVFTAGDDHEKPFLDSAWRITNDGGEYLLDACPSGSFMENTGWEKEDRLKLVFSKPVDAVSARNCLSAEGAPALVMESLPGFWKEIVFAFETVPVFESRFVFRLKAAVKDRCGNESGEEYSFRIFAGGYRSKPPELKGIRLPMAPGNTADPDPASFGIDSLFEYIFIKEGQDQYPSREDTETWIECYFETAPGAVIDPLSLMESFHIETSNNVLTFSPRQVKSGGFSFPDPRTGWESFQRLEIRGKLTNSTNFGVVHVQIAAGLKDSYGNRNEKSFRISLIK